MIALIEGVIKRIYDDDDDDDDIRGLLF